MQWTSTFIKYRLWVFEIGPVLGSVSTKGERAGTEIFDAVGSGYGGYFGIRMPVGKASSINLNATQVSIGEMIDKKERTIAIGPRLDLELGGRIALTKRALSATIGYRRRSYTITEASTAYAELQTATYVGFLLGTDF